MGIKTYRVVFQGLLTRETTFRKGMARLGVRLAKHWPWHFWELGAWTRGRELPKVPGPAFRDWWRKNGARLKPKKPPTETGSNDE